jgi:hypothetical protein
MVSCLKIPVSFHTHSLFLSPPIFRFFKKLFCGIRFEFGSLPLKPCRYPTLLLVIFMIESGVLPRVTSDHDPTLELQVCITILSLFFMVRLTCCLGWPGIAIILISASLVSRITRVSHCAQLFFFLHLRDS